MGASALELTTRCPHCGATFSVDFPSLQRRKGLVRCPSCASIFDAYEAVVPDEASSHAVLSVDDSPAAPAMQPPPETVPLPYPAPVVLQETEQTAHDQPEGRREPVWSETPVLGRSPRPIAATGSVPRRVFDAPPGASSEPWIASQPENSSLRQPERESRGPWVPSDDAIDTDDGDDGDALVIGYAQNEAPQHLMPEPPAAIPLRGRMDMQKERPATSVVGLDEPRLGHSLPAASADHRASIEPEFHLGQPSWPTTPSDTDGFSVTEPVIIAPAAGVGHDPQEWRTERSPLLLDDEHLPTRLPDEGEGGGRWMRVVWSVLCLVAGAALCLQLAYVYRGQLAAFAPALRPVLEQACASFGCEVPYERRIDDITIMRSALRAQPSATEGGRTMELSLTLRNQHRLPQAWPMLVLDLTDLSGARVVSMQLPPARYLSAEALADPFPAASDAEIALVLHLGDVQVNGYQLDKFFP